MTGADALQQTQTQQQRRGGTKDASAISLVEQIRSFNQQQFADSKTATSAHKLDVEMDVDSLFHDSDDDDDDEDQQQQQQGGNQDVYDARGHGSEDAAHSITGYESEDEVDEEEEAAFAMMNQLQLLQTRSVRKSAIVAAALKGSGAGAHNASLTLRKCTEASSVSAGMELTQAEERITTLEAQLLDAEEVICHLKAEKLAAFREVEKLTVSLQKQRSATDNNSDIKSKKEKKTEGVNIWKMQTLSDDDEEKPEQHEDDSGDDNNSNSEEDNQSAWGVKKLRTKVRELEEHLIEQQENQSLEQEEHMAVIREQELEIQKLKLDLERMSETCEDLEARLYRAFQVTSPVSASSPLPKRRSKSVQHVEFANNQEEDDEDDGDDGYDDGVFMRRSLGSLKGLRSPSLDSNTSISPGSESGNSSVGPLSNSESHLTMHWREELIRHPTPHFDLDSPEVHYLLHSWTTNLQKLHYLRIWFTQVVTTRGPLAHDFPLGVELPRLLPEIRDGFLTLVVPLLRKQTQRDIQVHSRQYNDQYHTDLRIRVIPRKR